MTAPGGTVSGPSIRAAYGDRAVAGLVSPGPSSCTAARGPAKATRMVALWLTFYVEQPTPDICRAQADRSSRNTNTAADCRGRRDRARQYRQPDAGSRSGSCTGCHHGRRGCRSQASEKGATSTGGEQNLPEIAVGIDPSWRLQRSSVFHHDTGGITRTGSGCPIGARHDLGLLHHVDPCSGIGTVRAGATGRATRERVTTLLRACRGRHHRRSDAQCEREHPNDAWQRAEAACADSGRKHLHRRNSSAVSGDLAAIDVNQVDCRDKIRARTWITRCPSGDRDRGRLRRGCRRLRIPPLSSVARFRRHTPASGASRPRHPRASRRFRPCVVRLVAVMLLISPPHAQCRMCLRVDSKVPFMENNASCRNLQISSASSPSPGRTVDHERAFSHFLN